jgi:hypothetical protein
VQFREDLRVHLIEERHLFKRYKEDRVSNKPVSQSSVRPKILTN